MKKNFVSFSLLICLCIANLVVRGQKEFYIPKALITPLHTNGQQLYTLIGIGGGISADISYALSHHLAAFASGTFNTGSRTRRPVLLGDRYVIIKNDRVFTYGTGYFTKLKGKLNTLETYVGYGTNRVNNHWYFSGDEDLSTSFTNANYDQFFCQVNIGRKSMTHDWIFAGRLSYSYYRDIQFYNNSPNTIYEKGSYLNMHSVNFDPAVCFSYHVTGFSFNVQAGISIPLSSSRHTEVNAFTTSENNMPVVTVQQGTATEVLTETFGRLGIAYTLTLKKQKNK